MYYNMKLINTSTLVLVIHPSNRLNNLHFGLSRRGAWLLSYRDSDTIDLVPKFRNIWNHHQYRKENKKETQLFSWQSVLFSQGYSREDLWKTRLCGGLKILWRGIAGKETRASQWKKKWIWSSSWHKFELKTKFHISDVGAWILANISPNRICQFKIRECCNAISLCDVSQSIWFFTWEVHASTRMEKNIFFPRRILLKMIMQFKDGPKCAAIPHLPFSPFFGGSKGIPIQWPQNHF